MNRDQGKRRTNPEVINPLRMGENHSQLLTDRQDRITVKSNYEILHETR